MIARELTPADTNWHDKIRDLEAILAQLRPELIEAEATLAEQISALNAFDFQVRGRLGQLTARLNSLTTEIKQYRQQLRRRAYGWQDGDPESLNWTTADFDAGESGDYRYMGSAQTPPTTPLAAEETADFKKLYRQLAFRFHPDMADSEEDRAYRTQIMMKINAAYAASDLAALEQLAQEPDLAPLTPDATPQQLAESLYREVGRVRHRLAEIKEELAKLERHERTKLMRRAERAAASGRDLLDELTAELKAAIERKLVERDILKMDLAEQESDEPPAGEDFADAVWDMILHDGFEEDLSPEYERYTARRRDRFTYEEDILDDYET
jgi:chromosome segregation ATPase